MENQFNICKEKMAKIINNLENIYSGMKAGRANPTILDKILVDYYGTPTPVNQLAAVSITESRILSIQPWDLSSIGILEKAIHAADIGINPTNDGKVIRLVFPQLTEEKRKEITKDISKIGEESKVSIRSVRRDIIDTLKSMKKNSKITEDDLKTSEKKIQNFTDSYCKIVEDLIVKKEKEIMSI